MHYSALLVSLVICILAQLYTTRCIQQITQQRQMFVLPLLILLLMLMMRLLSFILCMCFSGFTWAYTDP